MICVQAVESVKGHALLELFRLGLKREIFDLK